MLNSKTRWIVRNSNNDKVTQLVDEMNVTPLVASLLVNRGLEDPEEARAFLFSEKQEFHDPFLFLDMDKAVNRIKQAIESGEAIMIFGDYDADGVTSTTIMMKTLEELGANVQFYIPNRFTEGYGPNEGAFRYAHEIGISLIITVDTGIAALNEASVAKELGMDLIITDHHEPGPELPDAYAIIHPKREGSPYPFQELCGAGVAFKLAHALFGKLPQHLLQYAAIGTIADLVPLKDENRLITQKGLNIIRNTDSVGLKALFKLAGVEAAATNEETIGFSIAPRINAAGRLDSADPAVYLMLTEDPIEAESLAEDIEQLNKDRKELVNSIAAEAIQMVEEQFPIEENSFLIVGKSGWNAGVIGIVASKLVEKYYRPTIVLSYDVEKGLAKGSARSIAGFDLFKNLSTCRDILPHFGGHTSAAGMTLNMSDVEELRRRLNQLANEQLSEEDLIPITYIDTEVSVQDIHITSIEEMNLLAPYGMDNPKPKVLIKEAKIGSIRKIGSEQNHLKLTLEHEGMALDGVGFGLGEVCDHISPASQLSVIGELSINEWNNRKKPQIFLQDLAVSSWQLFDYRGAKKIIGIADSLPPEETKWIVFRQDYAMRLQKTIADGDVLFISSVTEAEEARLDHCHVVLVDLPPSKEILYRLLSGKKVARIYAHLFKAESDFFSTIPTREDFKWFYALIAKKGPFDLKKNGDAIAKHRGWTRETIDFMSQVFFELEFVTMKNGLIALNKDAGKRDLADSQTYQQKLAQYELEKELLYSSFQQLKDWFDQLIHETVKLEEAL
ncbi:single-stranded-DNA-specific exonuclease RecJ [Bacillus tuaregi]|uniref:single-stranded-DNA-specific exonuclease RecJ n=1 Tax=Bacillus tuaregi TaxID=1816695 RepID=UPI0008F92141|nr:single-stranded-DNA-specific exonuclease RecJ [Bacillus tuaregi]